MGPGGGKVGTVREEGHGPESPLGEGSRRLQVNIQYQESPCENRRIPLLGTSKGKPRQGASLSLTPLRDLLIFPFNKERAGLRIRALGRQEQGARI